MWKIGLAALAVAGSVWLISQDNCSQSRLYSAFRNEAADRLKSPSTAVFQPMKDAVSIFNNSSESCAIIVDGYVDSQNGFGAIVRSNVSGISRKDGDSFVVNVIVSHP